MAAPIAAIAKVAAAVLSDERGRKAVGWIVVAILAPVILLVAAFCSILAGSADHNNSVLQLCFSGGALPANMPAEYRVYVEDMQHSFALLDGYMETVNNMTEGETGLDSIRVKAIFYALYFGDEVPSSRAHQQFVDCFVTYEEREDGDTYTVAVPIPDLQTVYTNLGSVLGRAVTAENQTNAQRIYTLARYGQVLPGGNGLLSGEAMGDGSFTALMAEATRYIGWPYVWGGSSPATSFDCSGYICWVYTQSGTYSLPRTSAQGIFDQCAVVPREEAKPGDLIFFTGTYASGSPVSHVGIYVGGNQMLHCGSPIGYANIDSAYWSSHFYAIGRLPG